MAIKTRTSERRADALSKDRIVAAAISILDTEGESALTFRALASRLETGSGAIYWHIADKTALLAAAADHIIARAMAGVVGATTPQNGIRAIALGAFEAIDAHPWVGAQLFREPWGEAMLQISEGIGQRLVALGVPGHALFNAWSTLMNYILGVAGQNAANARNHAPSMDRATFLAIAVQRWAERHPEQDSFIHRVAAQLRDHDDREQFIEGLNIILSGIATLR